MRKTKIICTLGPAVDDINILRELIINGMDCARLNFSHGTHEEQKVRMDKIKQLRKELNLPIPLILDTKGPEIRIRKFVDGFINIKKGDEFTLSANRDILGDNKIVGLTYSDLAKSVKVGTKILIDDGKMALDVIRIEKKDVVCQFINDGKLSNNKSINIPNVIIEMDYISKADKEDIIFGISQDVDFIAASFVRRTQDIVDLRKFLDDNGGKEIKIISKIENTEGIKNMDDIIRLSDSVMVARGDMGVEVPFKDLPRIQKEMISKSYKTGKIVVTATQMLESMTKNPRPTRAEVSDVANAIYDKTTAIMLSGETAAGDYPIESVRTMAEIAEAAEGSINFKKRYYEYNLDLGTDFVSAIANSACNAAYQIDAKAIICVTRNGITANVVSSYHPKCPIIAVVINEKAMRQLNLSWNVKPVIATEQYATDALFQYGIEKALETGIVAKGDTVIITGGSIMGNKITDMFKLHII